MGVPDIQLDAPTQGGPPAVKFPNVGDSVQVGIVDVQDYHQRTIEGKPKFWNDDPESPMMGKRVIGLVLDSTNATLVEENVERPVVPGDLVSFFAEGSRHYTYNDAIREHGNVVVGDIMDWTFAETKPPKQKGYSPQKVYKASIRSATMADGEVKAMCVQSYMTLHNMDNKTVDEAPEGEEKFSV